MENIKLSNRYGYKVELVPEADDLYALVLDKEIHYVSIHGTMDSIIGIDPEGGPLIWVGTQLPNGKYIGKIMLWTSRNMYIIYTRENELEMQ